MLHAGLARACLTYRTIGSQLTRSRLLNIRQGSMGAPGGVCAKSCKRKATHFVRVLAESGRYRRVCEVMQRIRFVMAKKTSVFCRSVEKTAGDSLHAVCVHVFHAMNPCRPPRQMMPPGNHGGCGAHVDL